MKSQRNFKQSKLKKEVTGFTLVELLIASSILALTTVISWRGIDMVLRTQVRITTNERITENIEKTFAQLDFDVNNTIILQSRLINSINLYTTSFTVVRNTFLNKEPANNQTKNMGYQVVLYTIINTDLWRIASPRLYSEEDVTETLKSLSVYSPSSNNNNKLNETLMIKGITNFDISLFFQKSWRATLDYNLLVTQAKLGDKIIKNEGVKYKITMADGKVFNKTTALTF